MNLDLRTVIYFLIIGPLLMSVGLFAVSGGYKGHMRGVTRWALATLVQAIGWFVWGALRGVVPDVISVLLGNALLLTSQVLYFQALTAFDGRSARTAWAYALVFAELVGNAYFLLVSPNIAVRTVIASTCIGLTMVASGHLLLSGGKGRRPASYLLNGTLFLVCGGMLAVRALYYLIYATNATQSLFTRNTMQDVASLISFVTSVALTFGFVLMCNDRYNAEIRRLAMVAQHTGAAVVITDVAGEIEWVNAGFTALTGFSLEEATGRRPGSLLQGPGTDPAAIEQMRAGLTRRSGFTVEVLNYNKAGVPYWLHLKVDPIFDPAGRLTQFIAVQTDITERKRVEGELARALLAAEAATTAKSAFLATMSHELRTPLTSIIGFAALLEDGLYEEKDGLSDKEGPPGGLSVDQHDAAQTIHRNGWRLLNLINGILDLTKIEAGRFELDCQRLDVAQVCRDTITNLRPQAADKHLTVNALPQTATWVWADDQRVGQVLTNLLGNAIKFTPAGGTITVTIATTDDAVVVSVRDTGIGIAPDMHQQVFEAFVQVDGSQARVHEGTGLGLHLTRQLLELQGGTIWLVSEPGQGSTFSFSLPAHADPGRTMTAAVDRTEV